MQSSRNVSIIINNTDYIVISINAALFAGPPLKSSSRKRDHLKMGYTFIPGVKFILNKKKKSF